MNTPLLFDVPRSRTKRDRTSKHLLAKFKAEHDIETYRSRGLKRSELPWVACHMPEARRIGAPYGLAEEKSMGVLIAHCCRLLEESGVITEGCTEREAIQKLCKNVDIPFTL